MRYLYGDLSDFPRQANSLDLLRRFVDMAVELLRKDGEVERLLLSIEADKALARQTASRIDAFEQRLREAIAAAVEEARDDSVLVVLAEGAGAQLAAFVEDGRRRMQAKVEQGIARSAQEIDGLRRLMDDLLRGFFVDSGIPVTTHRIRFEFDEQNKTYSAWAQVEDVLGLKIRHRLKPADCEFFSGPRKGADLFPERLDLPVGTRKAWLKKEPVVDTLRIDEALLSSGEDCDAYLDLVFVPKGGPVATQVHFRIPKDEGSAVQIERADDSGQFLPVDSSFIDDLLSGQIRQMASRLAPELLSLFKARGEIDRIHLEEDEIDVVRARRNTDLIDRLARHMAPTIIEIHKRSPAPSELCLKVEHEGGRREEIYIRRSDLLARIKQLPSAQRSLFEPLQLDFVHRAGQPPSRESWDEITAKRVDPTGWVQRRDDKDATKPDPSRT